MPYTKKHDTTGHGMTRQEKPRKHGREGMAKTRDKTRQGNDDEWPEFGSWNGRLLLTLAADGRIHSGIVDASG